MLNAFIEEIKIICQDLKEKSENAIEEGVDFNWLDTYQYNTKVKII